MSSRTTLQLAADTVRVLSAEAVERANSGHPGMPMGAADYGMSLWMNYMTFNPQDPKWINRDRFVLSNGHGSMFLYSMLHLFGFDLTLDDIKLFRQWESRTPGHPESHMTPGVECTTGPLGQGISNAVGMAIAEQLMAARYNTDTFSVISHKIFCIVGDGCLMEGVSSEASSVAGHLGLSNLIVLYDDNGISIAGSTKLAFTEDVLKRYEAYGWNTLRADGHDMKSISTALDSAMNETSRPTMISMKSIIGKGSPNKAGDHDVHGSPLGKDELKLTKEGLGWPLDKEFYIPDEVKKMCADRVELLKGKYAEWQRGFEKWKTAHPEKAKLLDQQLSLRAPANLEDVLVEALPKDGKPMATRKLGSEVLQALSKNMPCVVGGSADLEPSTFTLIKGSTDVEKGEFVGKNLRFGVREHGMGAIMNGFAYYGGYVPYGSTFLCFFDYMKPTLRLAALSHIPGLFIYTHDSIFLGEDGPTHQPVEHLNSLRMLPNLYTFRPADGLETAVCYAVAAQRTNGPCAFALSRQNVDTLERPQGFDRAQIRRGGYVLREGGKAPKLVIVATGTEVGLAVKAASLLGENVRVVSMPCVELFEAASESYRASVIIPGCPKVVVEAGSSFGWAQLLGEQPKNLLFVTQDGFGASAPAKALAENFGFTPESIVKRVKEWGIAL